MTTCRDFLWPIAAVAGKALNFSPYQMLVTNAAGILWTAFTIFGIDHEEKEEKNSSSNENMNIKASPIARNHSNRSGFLSYRIRKWK